MLSSPQNVKIGIWIGVMQIRQQPTKKAEQNKIKPEII